MFDNLRGHAAVPRQHRIEAQGPQFTILDDYTTVDDQCVHRRRRAQQQRGHRILGAAVAYVL
jgi:hypothetical protein